MQPSAQIKSRAPEPAEAGIRVMLVDDSVVVRGLLKRWLAEVPNIGATISCRTGLVAVNAVEAFDPDVIILDIEMPDMDGITALPLLLKKCPNASVIMASSLSKQGAEITLKALALGAKDFIAKPETNNGVTTSAEFRSELIKKIEALGRARPRPEKVRPAAPIAEEPPSSLPKREIVLRQFSRVPPRILAVGSSTGGPQVLHNLFREIGPCMAHIPVVITQHMPQSFTAILAAHLSEVSGRAAAEGADGEPVKPGKIYVAPGGKHMILAKTGEAVCIKITDTPPVNFCKPAVDPLFESVADIYGSAALAVVLTGMGADGAKGALRIADKGGSVLAQDKESSVVWGMPGATANAGACAAILPPDELRQKIKTIIGRRS